MRMRLPVYVSGPSLRHFHVPNGNARCTSCIFWSIASLPSDTNRASSTCTTIMAPSAPLLWCAVNRHPSRIDGLNPDCSTRSLNVLNQSLTAPGRPNAALTSPTLIRSCHSSDTHNCKKMNRLTRCMVGASVRTSPAWASGSCCPATHSLALAFTGSAFVGVLTDEFLSFSLKSDFRILFLLTHARTFSDSSLLSTSTHSKSFHCCHSFDIASKYSGLSTELISSHNSSFSCSFFIIFAVMGLVGRTVTQVVSVSSGSLSLASSSNSQSESSSCTTQQSANSSSSSSICVSMDVS
eukprot:221028-Amphidinium_carterae.2